MFELKFLSGRFPLERKIRPMRGRANNTLARKIALKKIVSCKPRPSTPLPSPKVQFPLDCTSYNPFTAAPSPQTKWFLYEAKEWLCTGYSSYWTLHLNNNKSKFLFWYTRVSFLRLHLPCPDESHLLSKRKYSEYFGDPYDVPKW